MAKDFVQRLLAATSSIGATPHDSRRLLLEKTILVTLGLTVSIAALFWGSIYLIFREPIAAAIPFVYSLFSLSSIAIFHRTRRYRLFRSSQLVLILLLPFILMIVLGGFVNSGAVVVWSLLCPFGALVFAGRPEAAKWFAAYFGLVIISAILQRYIRITNNLTPGLILVFFVMNIGAVSAIAFFTLHYFVGQNQTAYDLLRLEREKSESLLLNMLPRDVAEELKNNPSTIAQHYPEASILFADIVNFTTLSTQLAPAQTVELLNEMFTHFDVLVEAQHLEKIRTIGDNYMVASGVPRPRQDHAPALANLALDMRDYLDSPQAPGDGQLQVRIGINSGTVIAGVIGTNKYQYDVWGDAVNIASRMESHGEPGKIQISQATFALLGDQFVCQPRGNVRVKGKGLMETWFLLDAKVQDTSSRVAIDA